MEAFERATGLAADGYWIEATAGGSPTWDEATRGSRIAHENGARHMGWSAHGDVCLGLPGRSNAELRQMLEETARRRAAEFPAARHYLLFATEDGVEVEHVRTGAAARADG